MFEVVTETVIAAPSSVVWAVLTDAAAYPAWNPGVVRVDGQLFAGARVKVTIAVEGRRLPKIPVEVRIFEPRVELAWAGGPRGLLQGTHYFRLRELDGGRTQLQHGERFVGILSPTLSPARRKIEIAYQGITDAIRRESGRRAAGAAVAATA